MRKLNIAMIVPYNTYDINVIEGAMHCARDRGDTEVYVWPHWHPSGRNAAGLPPSAERHLSLFKISGILADAWSKPMLRRLQSLHIPVVDIGGTWPDSEIAGVHVDNIAVGRMAARHLLDKGLRNFGFWGQPVPLHARQRRDAFVAEINKAGYNCSVFERETKPAPWPEKNKRAIRQWLASLPKPAGVMVWFDYVGIAAQYVCRLAGIAIPDEVALIGAGNDPLTQMLCHVPLTSINVNPERVGYKAMEVLIRMIHTGHRPSRHLLLPPGNVIARQSTDILASDNRELVQAMKFIQNNSDKPISVGDVLEAVPISRRRLEIQCQTLVGRTPRQQIQHVQIERAKMLVEHYDLSLGEIAEMSGFRSQVTFTNIFKRIVGCTPAKFRQQLKQLKPK